MIMAENVIDTSISIQLSREQILQATSRCLREFGYDATTIRRIAGLLGCAVGSIYRYFTDKRDLLSTVSQQTLEPVAAMVGAGEGFEQSVKLYHQLVTHAPETYRLMFWVAGPEVDGPPATAAAKLPEVVEQIINGWARQLGDAQTARRCWSLLHGFVLLGRDAEETLDAVRALSKLGSPTGATTPTSPPQPQIIITMNEPPPVRAQAAPVATFHASQNDAREDVCLL